MGKFIIADYSWLLNRFHYGFKDHFIKKDDESIFVGSIKGFCFLVERLHKKYPEHKVIFVQDGKCAKKEINEDYKANRDKDKTQIHVNTAHIVSVLSNLDNIAFAKNDGCEADDVIASIAYELKAKGNEEIIIYSGDKDFWQLSGDFKVANEYDKGFKFVDNNLIFSKFGVGLDNLLAFRILDGDKSDNLKAPVPFVKTEFKKLFAEVWNPTTPENFFHAINSFNGTKWEATAKKYLDVIDVIDNYLELMDLGKYSDENNKLEYKLFKGTPDRTLINFFELRQFESFLYDYIKEKKVNV